MMIRPYGSEIGRVVDRRWADGRMMIRPYDRLISVGVGPVAGRPNIRI